MKKLFEPVIVSIQGLFAFAIYFLMTLVEGMQSIRVMIFLGIALGFFSWAAVIGHFPLMYLIRTAIILSAVLFVIGSWSPKWVKKIFRVFTLIFSILAYFYPNLIAGRMTVFLGIILIVFIGGMFRIKVIPVPVKESLL